MLVYGLRDPSRTCTCLLGREFETLSCDLSKNVTITFREDNERRKKKEEKKKQADETEYFLLLFFINLLPIYFSLQKTKSLGKILIPRINVIVSWYNEKKEKKRKKIKKRS